MFIVFQILMQDTALKMYLDTRYMIHFSYLRYVYLYFTYYPALHTHNALRIMAFAQIYIQEI